VDQAKARIERRIEDRHDVVAGKREDLLYARPRESSNKSIGPAIPGRPAARVSAQFPSRPSE
jgi:hypothetical protein